MLIVTISLILGAKLYNKHQVTFKQDVNCLPKLSKGKWHSLDSHAETIGVILLRVKTCILGGMMPGKRMQYIDNIKKWTRTSLGEDVGVADDRTPSTIKFKKST